jgi:hypothetical protein
MRNRVISENGQCAKDSLINGVELILWTHMEQNRTISFIKYYHCVLVYQYITLWRLPYITQLIMYGTIIILYLLDLLNQWQLTDMQHATPIEEDTLV